MTTEKSEPDRPAALRDLAADAIRAAACPWNDDCPLTEAECSEQRIQPAAWEHGVLSEVYGRPEWFADAVLSVTDQAAALRKAADELDRYVGKQSSDAAPEVEGARLVIRELLRIAERPGPAAEARQAEPESPTPCPGYTTE